ncbi:MAG: hypothetical protein U0169_26870 [Polyangiaceae bacterium]
MASPRTTSTSRKITFVVTLASAAGAVVACGPKVTPPEFTLAFQSTHMAVATDVVQVSAYAVASGDGEFGEASICATLLGRLRKGQDLGVKPLVRSAVATPCEVQAGDKGSLDVSYGKRALVGIGYDTEGVEIVIGCTVGIVESGAGPISISMTLFDPTNPLPPASKCSKLADKCAGAC